MRDSFLSKIGIILVVFVAFIDGILVANHFNEKVETTKALPAVELEDIFAMYDQPEEPSFVEIREVPFTSQAPTGDWKSPWSDYAEEAVMTMVLQWYKNEAIQSAEQAEATMLDIGRYESSTYGDSLLASLEQVQAILNDFFGIQSELHLNPSLETLISALDEGSLIIAPVNGQILLNKHYGDPAPKNHMILIHAWESGAFITHDPGTRHGEDQEYGQEKILESIQDLDGELKVLIIQP